MTTRSTTLHQDDFRMARVYGGAPVGYVVKGRKKAWPMILSLVFGCVSCVVLGVAIIIALVVVAVTLAAQSTPQYYTVDDTRLASLPVFFCQNVSLEVLENTKDQPAIFEATMYVLDYAPPMSATKNPLIYSEVWSAAPKHTRRFQAYLLSQSTISMSACVPDDIDLAYDVYLVSGVTKIDSFSKNPTPDSSLAHKRVTKLCREGCSHLTYNVSEADYYAVVAVPEDVQSTTVTNITVTFNREEYSLDQIMNGSYPNCTSNSLTEPCTLPAPLGSNVLVVAGQPRNWNNNSYTPVAVTCAITRPSSFVLISVVPLVCVLLVICLAGLCGSFIAPHCSCKSTKKINDGEEGNHVNAALIPYVPRD